ncbi:respiratory nitrate reductase subunit gamma [Ottowia sp.]|uniref:respiratory nitrate reductase subunit gamma n=1 Tax=Ottowia sp. TaxID=1898956 RepID=UPI0025F5B963|nr:respiratory nitrate reductase subunit gamma [Ottowia sp.]
MPASLNAFLFGLYPYICLVVLLLGSLVRFDREPYSWKSDSSQILRNGQLKLGSNLFHYGVLMVILGHFVGFLMPEPLVMWLMSPSQHQLLAMGVGGVSGVIALVGATLLIHRRLSDQRIRGNSRRWDIAVIVMLWLQLALGVITVPLSAQHMDGAMFERLVAYVQGVVLLRGDNAQLVQGVPWVYQLHILLGFTIFLVSPFTRMVHIWSGVGTLAYLVRPHQIVRKRGGSLN